jgi:hypothetical protein
VTSGVKWIGGGVTISPRMPIYWSPKSVPELAALPKARSEAIWRQVMKLKPGYWWFWLLFLVGWVVVLSFLVELMIPAAGPWKAIVVGLSGAVFVIVNTHFRIARSLPEIRKRIGGLCLQCGYDIQATPDRCPECGTVPPGKELVSS